MELVCPLCNGLEVITENCPECGGTMKDQGRVDDYYGPYSPYDDKDKYEPPSLWDDANHLPCVHFFLCERCGSGTYIGISRQIM